jgi:hypothetical protein
MTPEPTAPLPHLVYGDWEWDQTTNRPGNLYPALIVSRWSGGVEFLTDKVTAERIVAAQQRIRAELTNPEDVDALAWDGDTIVYTGVDGSVYRYSADEGLYHCGFGWTWSEWTQEDDAQHREDATSSASGAAYTRGHERSSDRRSRPRRHRLGHPPVPDRRRLQRVRRRRQLHRALRHRRRRRRRNRRAPPTQPSLTQRSRPPARDFSSFSTVA